MARVAQLRGARILKRGGHLYAADETSEVILGQAVHDIAAALEFQTPQQYLHATAAERRAALQRKFAEHHGG